MYRNPYQNLGNGEWYKVNFHTHAGTGAGTCGANPTDTVVDMYVRNSFDILCISNHDLFSDTSAFTSDEILMIPGVEYSQDEHMLTIGVRESLHELPHQAVIDTVRGMGGFTILCHPNWIQKEYWSWERMDSLDRFLGIEIINMLIYRLNGSGLATDAWDHLLTGGKQVYGFGNDDFHQLSDASRSYNYIFCENRNYDAMKTAVENGAFCASTGLKPEYLLLESGVIKVKAQFPTATYVDTFTYRFIGEGGTLLSTVTGSDAQYTLNGENYVRVEVSGENGSLLFFQPVYRPEAFSDR